MKKLYLLVVFILFHFTLLHGQVSGDFRSKAGDSGLWNDCNAWETYNGSLWVDALTGQRQQIDLPESDQINFSTIAHAQGHTVGHLNPTITISTDSSKDSNFISTQQAKAIKEITVDFPDTIKIGPGLDYPSLTGNGGLFQKLNTPGIVVNKNLIVIITVDLTEDGTNAINAWTNGTGGPFTITINPAGKRKITFEGVYNNYKLCIKLDGTKGFTIDGLDDGVNNLSMIRAGGASSAGVIEFRNGASNNKITRTSIFGNNSTNCPYVITLVNSASIPLKNNVISFCLISSANTNFPTNQGVLLTGNALTANGTVIDHNIFANFSICAIHQDNGTFTNTTISNNEIYNTIAVSSGNNYTGINLTNNLGTSNIFNNKIHDIKCSSGTTNNTGISAIYCLTSGNDILNIYNNLIYLDVTGTQTGLGINGIKLNNIGRVNLYYNTVGIGGTGIIANNSYCINNENNGNLNEANNIVYNVRSSTAGTGKHYGIYNKGTVISNNNDLFVTGSGGYVGYQTTDQKTLGDLRTASGQDANSISVDPQFTSTTNSNYVPLNSALNIGTPISGITTDINGILRDVISPTVGAYEIPCNNPTTAGTIASDQTVWDNEMPALITSSTPASGYSGEVEYKWQSSVSPFNVWVEIPNSNALTYQPAKITEITLFKRLARAECKKSWVGAPESNVVTITCSTNKWKGTIDSDWGNPENWTRHLVPAEDTDIIFEDQPTHNCQLDQDRSVNNVTISTGGQLIIPVGKLLQVNGKIINLAGPTGLVIKASPAGEVANGSLIFHNDPTLDPAVQATVEMYTKASRVSGSYRWQFFGIPVKSIPANPTFAGSYVREMHENVSGSAGHWVQLQNESVLSSFTGYEITQDSAKIIRFEGELENRNFGSVELSVTPGATYQGEHLIANPYTAAVAIKNPTIPANSLTFGEGLDKTVYLYNTGSKDDWSNNGSNGGGDSNAPGQYLAVPQENAGSDSLPASIPSMQAFLVMVNTHGPTATVTIPYSSTGTILKNTTIQRAPGVEKVYTRIDVTGPNSGDRMWLFTVPTCTRGFDNGWDGYKLMGSALMPQIYASETDADYQVNSIEDINGTYLGFVAGADTAYTLKFTHHNTTTLYREIYLLDLIENKTIDITANKSQYSFLVKSGPAVERRFKIIATPANPEISTDIKSTKEVLLSLVVFSTQNTIVVKNHSNLNGNLYLYDLTGHCIGKMQFDANVITALPIHLPVGCYIAKAVTSLQEVSTNLLIHN
ncbi:MAG: hypothetical protein PHT07_02680 [Paludibacter sp.]|nr:hypothetical protein [Paludibacter sp.]